MTSWLSGEQNFNNDVYVLYTATKKNESKVEKMVVHLLQYASLKFRLVIV